MGKFTVVCALAFLVALGLNTRVAVGIEADVRMTKYTCKNCHTQHYGTHFEIGPDGDDDADILKNVRRISIRVPNGKVMQFKNTLGLTDIELSAWGGMEFEEFRKRFPEGLYKIAFYPQSYGRVDVYMTHDFPPIPEITYPTEGAAGVPLSPTITWQPLSGIDELSIEIESDNDNFEIEVTLPNGATSFTPLAPLKPNTRYWLSLETERGNNDSFRNVSFTTVASSSGASGLSSSGGDGSPPQAFKAVRQWGSSSCPGKGFLSKRASKSSHSKHKHQAGE